MSVDPLARTPAAAGGVKVPLFTTWYFLQGTGTVGPWRIEAPQTPLSQAFVCSTCGEMWARVFVEGASWLINAVPCAKHTWKGVQDFNRVPGSILHVMQHKALVGTGEWAIVIENLPPVLFRRELRLYLNHFEQEQRNHESVSTEELHLLPHPREERALS